jgi:hypothetical protein
VADFRIETTNYFLRVLRPGDENPAWQSWLADPLLMAQVNAKPARRSLSELKQYLIVMTAQKKAVVGVFNRQTAQLRAILEMQFDQRNRSVFISAIGDFRAEEWPAAFQEVDTPLLARLKDLFEVGRVSMTIPATYTDLIPALLGAGWTEEGTLRSEFPSVQAHARVDAKVFGKAITT